MSASDHAFIRAFTGRRTPGETPQPHFDMGTLTSKSVTVGAAPVAVSQYVTQPVTLPPAAVDAINARAAAADSDPDPYRRQLRIDNVCIQPVKDHEIAATASEGGVAERPSPGQPASQVGAGQVETAHTGVALHRQPQSTEETEFTATWEVDHFRWPEMCTRLQAAAAPRLTSVLRNVLHSAWRGQSVVAVTSYARGEGNSTVALCLAQMAAGCRVRVALVDGDWERPSIATSLGVESEHGWDALSQEIGIADVAIRSLDDELVVLPLRPPVREHTAEIGQRAKTVLQALSGAFELVILDAGPIFTACHRWFQQDLTPTIHSALVVRDVRNTDEHQVDDVCTRLSTAGIATVAIVENFRPPARMQAAPVHVRDGADTPTTQV